MTQEKKQFGADVGKILHLMIHSLYANKEIFMRELISNASDACDKLRYLAQTDSSLISSDPEFKIWIKVDKENKTIVIRDNGIGMNKNDLVENLGTIAKSGTQNFLEQMSGNSQKDSMLIGQFGVGFYSAFMVADKVTVTSRKAGEDNPYTWESEGQGEYTISDSNVDFSRGTEIVVHIKDTEADYLDHYKLKHIIKSYSDHISIPIFFENEGTDGSQTQVNSASAIWTRSKNDITPEQYQEFYKGISYSVDEPWITMHNKNEGAVEFTNLLFIPSTKTFDLFHPDRKRRVKLYIKRVFISDENIDIIPSYLRFLRGVVDSEDLPLNISRETLQHNANLAKIKTAITKRVLGELKKKKDESIEEYQTFWNNFGAALKEGLCEAISDHEKLLEVCIFRSALHDRMISLDEYIASCKDEQKVIYYLSGDDPAKLISSPQIEGFLSKNIDVLLFTDTVDDFWVNINTHYKDYEIKSVTRSDIDVDNHQSENNPEALDKNHEKLLQYFKEVLADLVKEVRISKKLTSSPACLSVASGAMDIRMERFLIEQKQLGKASAKVLEINPQHVVVNQIENDLSNGGNLDDAKQLVQLLFDQACIIEGEPVPDPSGFAKRFNEVLKNRR